MFPPVFRGDSKFLHMETILITGGTGLIGKTLTRLLVSKGYRVIILSRQATSSGRFQSASVQYRSWDVDAQTIDENAIREADVIVHLAGAGVAEKRWTSKRKREIVRSRTESSALLVKALSETPNKVQAVISASAIGWYDTSTTSKKTETDPPGEDFLGETCRLWEASIQPVEALHKRLVIIRTGIVLSNDGGALPAFRKPIGFGIAAILGSGKQVVSWIDIEDMARIYLAAITDISFHGIYNAVAPNPVTNRLLTLELAKKLKGRFYIPLTVPTFLLQLLLGEMSTEVLKSNLVSADKIRATGFQFIYPTIQAFLTKE